jgi:hypothetical protein
MSSTTHSAISCRASLWPSHGERLRPSRFGRSEARYTAWIATSWGKNALGTAARGVCKPIEVLGEKAFGPLAHDALLALNPLGQGGWGVPRS